MNAGLDLQNNDEHAGCCGSGESRGFLRDRPWIWIIVAFLVLIAVLASFVVISVKYGPKEIPIEKHGR